MLIDPKLRVVHTLGAVAKPNTREGIAYNLVRVFEKLDKSVLLLNGLTGEETDSTRMFFEQRKRKKRKKRREEERKRKKKEGKKERDK